jgi:hypothetical protein
MMRRRRSVDVGFLHPQLGQQSAFTGNLSCPTPCVIGRDSPGTRDEFRRSVNI